MEHRLCAVIAAIAIAAALPGVASAHVGRTLPVATDFTARILAVTPGLHAVVVDGDQSLWLRVPAASTATVPGTLGEPLLRFDPGGVWLNLRSPTAQADGIDRFALRPAASPTAPPLWHRVTSGHAYRWHEHRLHLLEPLAHGRDTAGALGPWAVPVVVDGRRGGVRGVLDYTPPGAGWAWLGGAIALAVAAAVAATRWPQALTGLAIAATALAWALRIGRELYGRPSVGAVGYGGVALTCAIGAALLYGLTRRDTSVRRFTAFLVGFCALYEGLTMLPLLTHSIALSALPTRAARVLEVFLLAGGIGTLVGSIFGAVREGWAAEAAEAQWAGGKR